MSWSIQPTTVLFWHLRRYLHAFLPIFQSDHSFTITAHISDSFLNNYKRSIGKDGRNIYMCSFIYFTLGVHLVSNEILVLLLFLFKDVRPRMKNIKEADNKKKNMVLKYWAMEIQSMCNWMGRYQIFIYLISHKAASTKRIS